MKLLVLGVTGMLGSAVFKMLSVTHDVWGTLRDPRGKQSFTTELQKKIISNVDVLNQDELVAVLATVQPDIVINCVGLIKQLPMAKDPLVALPINAMFPHRLSRLSLLSDVRVIHVSTDCVFSGDRGMYVELDVPDATDLYGKSKYLGELHGYEHCITLRTSIIGHELSSNMSLVDWFLSQDKAVKGYTRAIFSGLPTAELARVIRDYVIPNPQLSGLYHVSAEPIDKFSLLKLIAKVYGKNIEISPDDKIVIDRSLHSGKFRDVVDYQPPAWPRLIEYMFEHR